MENLWVWNGAPGYKNDALSRLQKELMARGITNSNDLKYFVAQTIQENGALDHMATHGDYGCALGIPQYNTCGAQNMKARTFLHEYTEWQSRDFQIRWLAERMTKTYFAYHSNIKLAVISHNCPECAAAGVDRYVCNLGRAGLKTLNGKTYTSPMCVRDGGKIQGYFRDEVSSKLSLLQREKD